MAAAAAAAATVAAAAAYVLCSGKCRTRVASWASSWLERDCCSGSLNQMDFLSFVGRMRDEHLDAVTFTSRWVAAERGIESARPDALFRDEFAAAMDPSGVGAAQSRAMKEVFKKPPLAWAEYHQVWVAVRTRYIDDTIRKFFRKAGTGQGGIEAKKVQVINFGSGLCTRPYRLDELTTGCRAYFELDLPQVVSTKAEIIRGIGARALCPLVTLSVDLNGEKGSIKSALLAAGFDPSVPTLLIAEGLSMYLSHSANRSMFEEMSGLCACGSELLVGFIDDSEDLLPRGIPFTIGPNEMKDLMTETGWRSPTISIFGDAELSYGRYPKGRDEDTSQCFCLARL